MSGCCHPSDYGEVFGARTARRDARSYRRRGLRGSARRLCEWLRPHAAGASVLEVGGGVGALQLELLAAGAATATNVELSPEYESEAVRLAEEAGVAARVDRRLGDFVASADLPSADLVVLHRVVCCYPDGAAMVAAAAARTSAWLAMTYPRDNRWVRAAVRVGNLLFRLGRRDFRAYVHDPAVLEAVAAQRGFAVAARDRDLVWESLLLRS